MICNNCGKENQAGTSFCAYCGTKFESAAQQEQPIQQPEVQQEQPTPTQQPKVQQEQPTQQSPVQPTPQKAENNQLKKLIPVIGGAFIVIVVAIFLIITFTSKISIKKYIAEDLEFSGMNGYGSIVSLDGLIDEGSINREILRGYGKYNDFELLEKYGYDYFDVDVGDYIDYKITSGDNGKLSNGDTVEITISIDKKGIKRNKFFKKGISDSDTIKMKYKVEGLVEPVAINVFDAIEKVIYDSTNGKFWIIYKNEYRKNYPNTVNVRTEKSKSSYSDPVSSIKVYSDNFNSFTVGVETVSDNISAQSKTVKVVLSGDADAHFDEAIVFKPEEAEVPVEVWSRVKNANILKEDLNKLNEKVRIEKNNKYPGKDLKLSKIRLYYHSDSDYSALVYFYKYGEEYIIYYYEGLKQDGSKKIIDQGELRNKGYIDDSWLDWSSTYTVDEIDKMFVHSEKYDIKIEK